MNLSPSLLTSLMVATLNGLIVPALAATGDADRGLALYQSRCATCHSQDYNGVGPAHPRNLRRVSAWG